MSLEQFAGCIVSVFGQLRTKLLDGKLIPYDRKPASVPSLLNGQVPELKRAGIQCAGSQSGFCTRGFLDSETIRVLRLLLSNQGPY